MKATTCACSLLVASLGAAVIFVLPPLLCVADETAPDGRSIDELVARLGADSFAVREAAAKLLLEREDAVPALRRALKSRDPEVARRAKDLLDARDRRQRERAFARLADQAKRGVVDQAVEEFVRHEKWDDETACWQLFAELAGKLTDLEREKYGKASLPDSDLVPARDFRRYVAKMGRDFQIIAGRRASPEQVKRNRVIRAEDIIADSVLASCLLVSSGSIKAGPVHDCVIFAGGSINLGNTVHYSLIVCDGDVSARDIYNSLVIARGAVRCESDVSDSRIVSCSGIQIKRPWRVFESKVVEKEAKPLGIVTFFDPADVGIKVESADGGVRVKEAEKGKPFAATGLRADDVVTALDGDTIKDAESFRRLLRAKFAVEGTTTLKVRRGNKAIEIPVAHKDPDLPAKP